MLTIRDIPERIRGFLHQHMEGYEIIVHDRDQTAHQAAIHTHTPEFQFAKTVLVKIESGLMGQFPRFGLAVLPANHRIDFHRLSRALETPVVLAPEEAMRELFPDCEIGAEPPLGNLYGLPVYVSAAMALDYRITFNAGTHDHAIEMRFDDFERLVCPRMINFSIPVEAA